MVAGRELSPGDAAATERLMRYWAEGPGCSQDPVGCAGAHVLAELSDAPVEVTRHVQVGAQALGVRATGARPGHAASEQ